ncbi:MAG: hypothetical protein ACE5KZ_04710 [Candidatus Scalinduaceae bacterium]
MVVGCSKSNLPDQTQSSERIQQISRLDIQRSGYVNIDIINLEENNAIGKHSARVVHYDLQSPSYTVEDTDIRGYLDGRTKYLFNQGKMYHMRVGRRYNGASGGELELKRSLVRWFLPEIPEKAFVKNAGLVFWVETFEKNSPLKTQSNKKLPLHLYAYPISSGWGEGLGGVKKDNFSRAALGEVSWNEERAGQLSWPAPGALIPDTVAPLAVGIIDSDDKEVILSSESLRIYVEECLHKDRSLDLLLKLDDQEEDCYGTEMALETSDFGSIKDAFSRRPKLSMEIEFPYPYMSFEKEFTIESGKKCLLPVIKHYDNEVLLTATVLNDTEKISPHVWVRGGKTGDLPQNNWERLDKPLVRPWEWSQIKLAMPNCIKLGDKFAVNLLEGWISPGPREKQLPEMVAIAPSGKIHIIIGSSSNLSYKIQFLPDELGLWKYGWSFIPYKVSSRHQGEGLFCVEVPDDLSQEEKLKDYANKLIALLKNKGRNDFSVQYKINSTIRWATGFARKGERENDLSQDLLKKIREVVPLHDSRLKKILRRIKNRISKTYK